MAEYECVPNPRVVASFGNGDVRAERRAEWVAGEQRDAGHPEAHVHYRPSNDTFVTVISGGAS